MMRTLTKGLVAGAVNLAVLVPGGLALAAADDDDDSPNPICTDEQRREHGETHDRLQAEIRDQLREEGVTDPDEVRDQVRTRLHDAMEDEYGEMPGLGLGMGAGMAGYRHGSDGCPWGF